MARVQTRSKGRVKTPAGRLLVSTSFATAAPIPERLLQTADYVLYHGNGLATPQAVHARAKQIRATSGYRGQPLLINEDDHFDFDKPENNMLAAVEEYSGWGYFDYRQIRERFEDGYQSLPVDWGINSARKKGVLLAAGAGDGCSITVTGRSLSGYCSLPSRRARAVIPVPPRSGVRRWRRMRHRPPA